MENYIHVAAKINHNWESLQKTFFPRNGCNKSLKEKRNLLTNEKSIVAYKPKNVVYGCPITPGVMLATYKISLDIKVVLVVIDAV